MNRITKTTVASLAMVVGMTLGTPSAFAVGPDLGTSSKNKSVQHKQDEAIERHGSHNNDNNYDDDQVVDSLHHEAGDHDSFATQNHNSGNNHNSGHGGRDDRYGYGGGHSGNHGYDHGYTHSHSHSHSHTHSHTHGGGYGRDDRDDHHYYGGHEGGSRIQGTIIEILFGGRCVIRDRFGVTHVVLIPWVYIPGERHSQGSWYKDSLSKRYINRPVTIHEDGSFIVNLKKGVDENVSEQVVRQGWGSINRDAGSKAPISKLAPFENNARSNRLGIWQDGGNGAPVKKDSRDSQGNNKGQKGSNSSVTDSNKNKQGGGSSIADDLFNNVGH